MPDDIEDLWERDDRDMAEAEHVEQSQRQSRYVLVELNPDLIDDLVLLDYLDEEAERFEGTANMLVLSELRNAIGTTALTAVRRAASLPPTDIAGGTVVTVTAHGHTVVETFDRDEMGALRTHLFGRGNDINPWGRGLKKLRLLFERSTP